MFLFVNLTGALHNTQEYFTCEMVIGQSYSTIILRVMRDPTVYIQEGSQQKLDISQLPRG